LAYLLSSYYHYFQNIELVRNTEGHGFTIEKKEYLESLHQIYLHKMNSYLLDEEKSLLDQVDRWIAQEMPFIKISDELLKLHREQKNKNAD
jgi:uncharacterized membrane protein YheB (UPF0754 family)